MTVWRLDGANTTLLLLARGVQLPEVVHWGARLPALTAEDVCTMRDRAVAPNALDDDVPFASVLPTLGAGIFGAPALAAVRGRVDWTAEFRLDRVEERPHALVLHASDPIGHLTLEIRLSLAQDGDTLIQSVAVTSGRTSTGQRASSRRGRVRAAAPRAHGADSGRSLGTGVRGEPGGSPGGYAGHREPARTHLARSPAVVDRGRGRPDRGCGRGLGRASRLERQSSHHGGAAPGRLVAGSIRPAPPSRRGRGWGGRPLQHPGCDLRLLPGRTGRPVAGVAQARADADPALARRQDGAPPRDAEHLGRHLLRSRRAAADGAGRSGGGARHRAVRPRRRLDAWTARRHGRPRRLDARPAEISRRPAAVGLPCHVPRHAIRPLGRAGNGDFPTASSSARIRMRCCTWTAARCAPPGISSCST